MTTQSYMEKFQNLVDVIEYSGGTVGMQPSIVEALIKEKQMNANRMSTQQKDEVNKEAQGMYLAVTFIVNSNKGKYGKLLEDLDNSYLQGDDKYPRTITGAYNLLTNWKQDVRNIVHGPANDGVSFANVEDDEGGPNITLVTDADQNEFPKVTCH